jgi:hypothetical protein
MASNGRADRNARLTENRSGAWGSSSADFIHLAWLLFGHSKAYAETVGGNCSPYALSGVPTLLSSLRCLVVEYASYPPTDLAMLKLLTEPNDFEKTLKHYSIIDPLRSDALLLQEVRNEIIHPAHRPSGTADNFPNYLRKLKERGLTQSAGRGDTDYIFFSQLQSHRLFAWSWQVTRDLVKVILNSDPRKAALVDFLQNYESPGQVSL